MLKGKVPVCHSFLRNAEVVCKGIWTTVVSLVHEVIVVLTNVLYFSTCFGFSPLAGDLESRSVQRR